MSSKDILLLNSTPEILQLYSNALGGDGCRLISPSQLKSGSRKKKVSSPLVIVESHANAEGRNNWIEEIADLHDPAIDSCVCIIAGSSKTLKENISRIGGISRLIFDKDQNAGSRSKKSTEKESSLVDLLEQKISEFVVKMKSAGGKDLYPLLIREIERHLIRLILKEAGGNQVKAAKILGINRNTLRNKIKELKISLR